MAVKTEAVGKAYPPFEYEVGKEKIAEYARAIGAENPVHFDRDAARDAGFRDVVAPPMFAVVYSAGSVAPGIFDPEVGIEWPDVELVYSERDASAPRLSEVAGDLPFTF